LPVPPAITACMPALMTSQSAGLVTSEGPLGGLDSGCGRASALPWIAITSRGAYGTPCPASVATAWPSCSGVTAQ